MLTRDTVFEISREGYRLLDLKVTAVGRKLRRFLERVSVDGIVMQSFAFNEGHTPRQLETLRVYAQYIAHQASAYLPAGAVEHQGVVFDDGFALVANHYKLRHDIATASVAELRKLTAAVVVLAECMHEFAANANRAALSECPDYVYRNLPCNIVTDDQLWAVSGQDVRGGSGVLEWCYDEADARDILEAMNRFPERFLGIEACKWSEVVESEALATA